MDIKNMATFCNFSIIIIVCSFSAITCNETANYGDEMMETSEQIGFRPLFRHRQLMEERNRLKQQRLDELSRRSNTKHKLLYGDFKGYKPQPYTITYITWNKTLRDKQTNKMKTSFSDQFIRNRPYFYTSTNNYYPLNSQQNSGNKNNT